MRAKRVILASLATVACLGVTAQTGSELAESLSHTDDYLRGARFEVLLPNAADPVTYDVILQSRLPEGTDTLSPCDYVIRWRASSSDQPIEGFTAYYDGNHYRYRNNKLQEYHAEASLQPFMPLGPGSDCRNGVQNSAQFVDLLPQFIGQRIARMAVDSAYIYTLHPDTLVNGIHRIVLDGVKRHLGYDQLEYTYVFDRETMLPVYTETINSPGSISEQIVTVTYSPTDAQPIDISEQGLMAAWPDVFELYRESTFRAENMVNALLPKFACQLLGSDQRYMHNAGEAMDAPTVMVFLDPDVATTRQTIDNIRDAMAMSPRQVSILWIFNSNRSEEISDLIGTPEPDEQVLLSANSLIRNCGITMFPTIVLVNKSSRVADVISGVNNDTGMIVLQKSSLLD